MNQIQTLIDSIRDAPHDAVIAAGMSIIPVLIVLWIVNRMRHPERGLLNALVIASVGFVVVPWVSSVVLILWVRTAGDSMQAAFVGMFLFVAGSWGVLLICGPAAWEYFFVIWAVLSSLALSYPPPWTHSRSRSFSHALTRSPASRIFSGSA